MPIWGYLLFFTLSGRNPNPFLPITAPSETLTLLPMIRTLLKTYQLDAMLQNICGPTLMEIGDMKKITRL